MSDVRQRRRDQRLHLFDRVVDTIVHGCAEMPLRPTGPSVEMRPRNDTTGVII